MTIFYTALFKVHFSHKLLLFYYWSDVYYHLILHNKKTATIILFLAMTYNLEDNFFSGQAIVTLSVVTVVSCLSRLESTVSQCTGTAIFTVLYIS